MTYYKQIDSFRFFTAIAVITTHWFHYIPIIDTLKLGFVGVDFFFVISGFLISHQLYELRNSIEQNRVSFSKAASNFIIRRGLRIMPLYYFILILATLFNKNEIRDAFFYNITYTSNFYFIKVQHWNSTFSHFWSLSVEEHFYLCWPVIVLLINRRYILLVIIAVLVAAVAFRYVHFIHTYDYYSVHLNTLSCLDLFMCGAALAYFLLNHRKKVLYFFSLKSVKYLILLTIFFTHLGLIFIEDSPIFSWVCFRFIFGILSAGLIGLLVVGFKGRIGVLFENKWLIAGGKLSYAIYLLHNFIPGILLGIQNFKLPLIAIFLIYFLVTILFSMILYKFIETPLRIFGQKSKIKYD